MPAHLNIVLDKRQRFTRRNADLPMDEIDSSNQLGHRMFHLQARVHLQEKEVPSLVHEEFDRAGITIACGFSDANSSLTHFSAHFCIHHWCGRFLQHFLMAALDRALALAEVYRVSVFVSEHLHLDVPWMDDRLLQVDFVVAESMLRLAASRLQRRVEFFRSVHQTHAFAAAAGRGL